jgi:hypothetical protein
VDAHAEASLSGQRMVPIFDQAERADEEGRRDSILLNGGCSPATDFLIMKQDTIQPPQEVEVLPTLEMSECPQDFQVSIRQGFGAFMQQADELVKKGQAIAVADESPEQEKAARETRLALVKVRTGAEKLHKEMKAGILIQGRAIDGAKNIVIAATEPTEKAMKAIEDRAELRAEEERRKLHEERYAELNKYTTAYNTLSLGRMTAEECAGLLDDAKLAHEARIAREKRQEEERIAAEKAAEEARIAAEKAAEEERQRLAKERAELEAKLAAEKAERERIEAEAKAEREAAEVERKRLEAEREAALAEERKQAEEERARLEAEMKAQREKAEAAERAAKAEADRLAKIEEDRMAAELAEVERRLAEEEKAALAPDKEKIAAYAKAIKAVAMPVGVTKHGKAACAQIGVIVDTALAEIRTIYQCLK